MKTAKHLVSFLDHDCPKYLHRIIVDLDLYKFDYEDVKRFVLKSVAPEWCQHVVNRLDRYDKFTTNFEILENSEWRPLIIHTKNFPRKFNSRREFYKKFREANKAEVYSLLPGIKFSARNTNTCAEVDIFGDRTQLLDYLEIREAEEAFLSFDINTIDAEL